MFYYLVAQFLRLRFFVGLGDVSDAVRLYCEDATTTTGEKDHRKKFS